MKRALVLSGGGFLGAFQVPIANALMAKYNYSAIYGNSIGAFNGALLACGKHQELEAQWCSIKKRQDMVNLHLRKDSLVSFDPAINQLKKLFTLKEIKVPLTIVVCSLNNGLIYRLNSSEFKKDEDFLSVIRASASIAGLFEPVAIGIKGINHICIDGGFRQTIPIPDEPGLTHIDIISCHNYDDTYQPMYNITMGMALMRAFSFMRLEAAISDLKEIQSAYPKAKISIYLSDANLGSPGEVSSEITKFRMEQGRIALQNPILLEDPYLLQHVL